MGNVSIKNRMIDVSYAPQQIATFLSSFKNYNLNPVFQRKAVWKIRDRQRFIETILEGMPCPTVFVFHRWDKHKLVNDVIDGKQRLETIYLFSGKLSVKKLALDSNQKRKIKDWLKKSNLSNLKEEQIKAFYSFSIPVGQLVLKDTSDGSDQGMGDVIEAFVRINTQGKPLTKQEQSNAHYMNSPLLLEAKKLSKDFHKVFHMSEDQIGRMKDIEMVLELLITVWKKETQNKKTVINKALEETKDKSKIKPKELQKVKKVYKTICALMKKIDMGSSTRFTRKTSDYYSLFKAFMELQGDKVNFSGHKQFGKVKKHLSAFSAEVAEIAEAYKNKKFPRLKTLANSPQYKYWFTTQSNTDSKDNRQQRTEILKTIISRTFSGTKDKKRFFSIIQKEQIWEASKNKKCVFPGCSKLLTWESATVDHVIPWSLGGATDIANAQLLCKTHNSMKKDKAFDEFKLNK